MTDTANQTASEHQLDVLRSMTELLESLPTEASKREVMAFLYAKLPRQQPSRPQKRKPQRFGLSVKRKV